MLQRNFGTESAPAMYSHTGAKELVRCERQFFMTTGAGGIMGSAERKAIRLFGSRVEQEVEQAANSLRQNRWQSDGSREKTQWLALRECRNEVGQL
jgi:hypothetical protein